MHTLIINKIESIEHEIKDNLETAEAGTWILPKGLQLILLRLRKQLSELKSMIINEDIQMHESPMMKRIAQGDIRETDGI